MRSASQPSSVGSPGEAVAGYRRQDEVERVLGVAAVRGRVGQRADGLEQLDDRAGPAVGHDQRQRVLVRRAHVDEVDVHAVDLGRELRQRVQSRLEAPEVVFGRPVAHQRLHRRELHTLRAVVDELAGRPARRRDACTQVLELRLGSFDREWADRGVARWLFGHDGHVGPPGLGLVDLTEPDRAVCTSRPSNALGLLPGLPPWVPLAALCRLPRACGGCAATSSPGCTEGSGVRYCGRVIRYWTTSLPFMNGVGPHLCGALSSNGAVRPTARLY